MIKHGKILVTTDFSKCADEGLRRAKVLAKKLGADLHLLHVLDHVLIGSVAERVVCHAPCTVMVTRPHGIFE